TPANFTLGSATVPMPANSFNQQGVAVGRNPTDPSAVTTAQITSVIPELKNASSVPNGIYVPVADKNGVCRSDSGAAMMGGVYVHGNINALSGTLQQNEQASIVSAGSIGITGNVLYQTPPNPADPNSNPINVLGLYAAGGDIQIMPTAPNNLIIDAILMAGSSGSAYNSSVNVQNWNTGSPRGNVNLLGGMIEKYYGNFGSYNSTLGQQATGYGRAF